MSSDSLEDLKRRVCDAVDQLSETLLHVSHTVHANPELAFEEHEASCSSKASSGLAWTVWETCRRVSLSWSTASQTRRLRSSRESLLMGCSVERFARMRRRRV